MIPDRLSQSILSAVVGAVALGLALGLALAPAAAQGAPVRKSHAEMVRDVIDTFIMPRVEALSARTAELEAAVAKVCSEGGSEAARKAAVSAFGDTVRAWGGLDFVRFGPVSRQNRLERMLFWPDPRGFASRQLNGLLAARKPELLQPGGLARQSVAVQGLPALEILLFSDKIPLGTGTDEAARYRCAMAAAIAANMRAIAGEILSGWTGDDGYRMKMLAPGSDNPLYRDSTETVREVAKAMAMGIELSRDRFILPELTAVTAAAAPRRVRLAFESAGLTGAYVEASLHALEELFGTLGLAAYVPADKPWMTAFLPNAWKSVLADVAKLDTLRARERGSDAHLHVLRKMRFELSGIRQIIFKELAPNAGIEMGINALDGD